MKSESAPLRTYAAYVSLIQLLQCISLRYWSKTFILKFLEKIENQ